MPKHVGMKLRIDCVYCLVHETMVRYAEQTGEAEQEGGRDWRAEKRSDE